MIQLINSFIEFIINPFFLLFFFLPFFNFDSKNNLKYKTFITQEMLKSKILASNVIYICVKHDLKKFNDYFNCLDPIFEKIADCEKGYKIDKILEGPVCHSTFQRLN